MKSRIITLALLVLCIISCKEKVVVDNTQHANPGRIDLYENFKSAKFRPSNVLVWVPDDYNTNTQYAVLYMHDAQMLFDETTTWNKQTWNIDSIAASLQRNDRCRPFIIVGIENHPTDRLTEYLPTKIAYFLSTQNELMLALNRSKLVGDEYLEFIVNELKPFIDSTYSTLPDAENTAIMGSSMGGLISLYAISEYPQVFGSAGCLSTHTPIAVDMLEEQAPIWSEAFRRYLMETLPKPGNNKIYMDCGDQTIDSAYIPFQKEFDAMFASLGWDDTNYMTRFYPGHAHDEISWQSRLHIPLEWIFGKEE
mgnify:CR=1 FL=1